MNWKAPVMIAWVLILTLVGCSASSTAPKLNYLTSLNGAWGVAGSTTSPTCVVSAHLNLTEDAQGNLSGTADMEYCNTWQSGTAAITAGSKVNASTGQIVINAAAPLGDNFFVGGEQITSASAVTGLSGQINGDSVQWNGTFQKR